MTVRFVISTSTAVINDPALRVADKSAILNPQERKTYKAKLAKYKASHAKLPSIWARKTVNHPSYYKPNAQYLGQAPSKTELYHHREGTAYFPFCEPLYKIATTDQDCDWIHCAYFQRLTDDTYHYNFPCGCSNPTIVDAGQFNKSHRINMPGWFDDSARMLPNVHTDEGMELFQEHGYVEIPKSYTFRGASTGKREKGRKRKVSNLTDHKSYRKLLRSRRSTTARCSAALQGEEDDDSDGWGV